MTSNDTIAGRMPQDAFAALGGGQIAYLRPVRSEDVHTLFPQAPRARARAWSSGRCSRPRASRSC